MIVSHKLTEYRLIVNTFGRDQGGAMKMLAIQILQTVFLGTVTVVGNIEAILFMVGVWMMFEKSGIRGLVGVDSRCAGVPAVTLCRT